MTREKQLQDAVSDARRAMGLSRQNVADLAGVPRGSIDALYDEAHIPEAHLKALQRWVEEVE